MIGWIKPVLEIKCYYDAEAQNMSSMDITKREILKLHQDLLYTGITKKEFLNLHKNYTIVFSKNTDGRITYAYLKSVNPDTEAQMLGDIEGYDKIALGGVGDDDVLYFG